MTSFMRTIFQSVKKVKPDVQIAMSACIYPFSKEEYLQDWPRWIREGIVDMVIPQLYEYTFDRYQEEMHKVTEQQIDPQFRSKVAPGMLIKLGKYYPDTTTIRMMIQENRNNGFSGEVFFFFEGLLYHRDFFQSLYLSSPAIR